MNSVPNSDLEQYTKSKLSRVYSAHTLTQPVRIARTGRLVVVVSWSVERRIVAMSQACPAVSPRACASCRNVWACCVAAPLPIPSTIQNLYRDTTPTARAACYYWCAPRRIAGRVVAHCCRVAALYRNPVAPYCNINGCPHPRYNFFFSRLTLGQAMRARALLHPRAQVGRVVGRIVALPHRVVAFPCAPSQALCHDTIFCIVTRW